MVELEREILPGFSCGPQSQAVSIAWEKQILKWVVLFLNLKIQNFHNPLILVFRKWSTVTMSNPKLMVPFILWYCTSELRRTISVVEKTLSVHTWVCHLSWALTTQLKTLLTQLPSQSPAFLHSYLFTNDMTLPLQFFLLKWVTF